MNCSEQNFENYMDVSIKFKKGSIVVVISYHYYHYCCMTPCACACGLIIFWIHAISQTDVFISAQKVYSSVFTNQIARIQFLTNQGPLFRMLLFLLLKNG